MAVAKGMPTAAMCAKRTLAALARAGNSGLFGAPSRRPGHDRGHSSLVGPRQLYSQMEPDHRRDRRAAGRPWDPGRTAAGRRTYSLPAHGPISRHAFGPALSAGEI